MNSIYRQNFEQVRRAYPLFFAALEKCCRSLDIDFYLIGAQSRNVWTAHLNLPVRTTSDVDYCVYVPDRSAWNQLTAGLIATGTRRDEKLPYRFYAGTEMMDLIPFGGIEENGEVILDDPTIELSVVGCRGTLTGKLFDFTPKEIDEMYASRGADEEQTLELKLIAETIRGIND